LEFRRIKNRNHLGFSLIEVLIVLIIIGIAGSISISGFGSMMNESEKKEVRKIILFLDSKINHVFQTGEALDIQFKKEEIKVSGKLDTLKLKNIIIEQQAADMKSVTNEFDILLNHKSLIDSIYLTLKEPSQEIKLKLGLNGAEVQ
jgi:prepilin-type N-terminal cleavage/methylation domain-containing protein